MKPLSHLINLSEHHLFETERILKSSHLVIHDAISHVVLLGSRGLQGGYREDSDIDLGLLLDPSLMPSETLCNEVLEVAHSNWTGDIKLDSAVVFDKMNCGLVCYQYQEFHPNICRYGMDCIGLYKIQKGCSGFIPEMGLDVKQIYPILLVWERGAA